MSPCWRRKLKLTFDLALDWLNARRKRTEPAIFTPPIFTEATGGGGRSQVAGETAPVGRQKEIGRPGAWESFLLQDIL